MIMNQFKDKEITNNNKDINDIEKLLNLLDPHNNVFDKSKTLIKKINDQSLTKSNDNNTTTK